MPKADYCNCNVETDIVVNRYVFGQINRTIQANCISVKSSGDIAD
jgi:hypothetical protein